jgi:hypothetical protein
MSKESSMTRQFLSAALHALLAPLLLYGGIYVSFYLFIYYFNIPDGPLPLVLKILAGLGMPVLVLAGGGLWGGALALQRGEPVRPNFKKGLRTWGLTVIPGIILLDLTQIPAFILVRFLPFPHRFHYLFTLFFVPGIGLATWIMVRVMARALGMAASARAAAWSAFAAGGVFLAASLVLLFVYGWEVAGPLAGRQYNMLMIAHVCGFAAAAAAGAVFGWYLGAPAGASAADRSSAGGPVSEGR